MGLKEIEDARLHREAVLDFINNMGQVHSGQLAEWATANFILGADRYARLLRKKGLIISRKMTDEERIKGNHYARLIIWQSLNPDYVVPATPAPTPAIVPAGNNRLPSPACGWAGITAGDKTPIPAPPDVQKGADAETPQLKQMEIL